MEDIRNSLSKLKKGFKHRVGSKKRGPDREGTNTTGERVGSSASLPRPDPRVVVSGHEEEGSGISPGISRVHSGDPSPHPEPAPADQGRFDDPKREEVDVGEKEVSWRHSNMNPDAAGSSPSREIERASSPTSVSPIPLKQEPDSTSRFFPSCCI